jgi:DNA-binding CsgD family transcriptional regulator
MSGEQPGSGTRQARLLKTLEKLLALGATELGTAMRQAAQQVAEVLGADKVDVFLHHPDVDALVAVGTSDTPMGRRQHELGLDGLPLKKGGRAVRVFQTGQPYLSPLAHRDPVELAAIIERLGVRSAIFAPLAMAGERRGVLLASSARRGYFEQEDLGFLEAVARWIGMVGERALHVEQLTQSAAEAGYRAAAEQLLSGLTPRQREIAALIARGYSNAEIARELVLVPGTVANHVEQILTRLGFRNRTQVAAWAAELGLHRSESGTMDRTA